MAKELHSQGADLLTQDSERANQSQSSRRDQDQAYETWRSQMADSLAGGDLPDDLAKRMQEPFKRMAQYHRAKSNLLDGIPNHDGVFSLLFEILTEEVAAGHLSSASQQARSVLSDWTPKEYEKLHPWDRRRQKLFESVMELCVHRQNSASVATRHAEVFPLLIALRSEYLHKPRRGRR